MKNCLFFSLTELCFPRHDPICVLDVSDSRIIDLFKT